MLFAKPDGLRRAANCCGTKGYGSRISLVTGVRAQLFLQAASQQ